MKKPLVVLAAGMGSRYGGLKQMDPIGPSGEFILDYSVFDALRAGFTEIIFVIRRDIEEDFRRIVGQRWEQRAEVKYAFQAMDDLPAGFRVPPNRAKPWGTGHAVLAAREFLDAPFAVVNADDFYGSDAFANLAAYLDSRYADERAYAMVAYEVGRTLSAHGAVARGICSVNPRGELLGIAERTDIIRGEDGLIRTRGEIIDEDTPVSLNLFGFKPAFVKHLREQFATFLNKHGNEEKTEFFMPEVIGELIRQDEIELQVLRTESPWIGVTNAADRPAAVAFFADLAGKGVYPASLF